jgi:hypothetical protein
MFRYLNLTIEARLAGDRAALAGRAGTVANDGKALDNGHSMFPTGPEFMSVQPIPGQPPPEAMSSP